MGRNKEQKGKDKGGFWKLGIDPKKLYKKRIRNRKLNNTLVNKKKIVNKGIFYYYEICRLFPLTELYY